MFSLVVALATSCNRNRVVGPNILLIIVDTLRADRLGAYGGTRGLTPFIDSLAARGFVFANAFAASCWTNPSIASLITSRETWQHRVTSLKSVLAPDEVTLAEVLRAHGYATAGWSANVLLRRVGGWQQGLDHYVVPAMVKTDGVKVPVPVRGPVLNRMAADWWRAQQSEASTQTKPGYVYLHYMEPHSPYAPPKEVLDDLFRGQPMPDVDMVNDLTWVASYLTERDPERKRIEEMYDAGVLAADRALAHLFAELEKTGFLKNAVVVLTADHGEGLWDHGAFGHGGSLFDELIRVPLLILMPGQTSRVDVDLPVSLVDVAPTLLDLAGLPRPQSFVGQSVADLLSARRDPSAVPTAREARVVFSDMGMTKEAAEKLTSSNHRRAVMMGQYKLIAGPNGHEEFFDRGNDPRSFPRQKSPKRSVSNCATSSLRVRPLPMSSLSETARLLIRRNRNGSVLWGTGSDCVGNHSTSRLRQRSRMLDELIDDVSRCAQPEVEHQCANALP